MTQKKITILLQQNFLNPTENKGLYKKQRNKCVSLGQKEIKVYSNNVTKTGVQTNMDFWKLIKLFFANGGFLENMEIMLAEKDKLVAEEKVFVRIFNNH